MTDTRPLAERWLLDPAIHYLNHGSFGSCPRDILEAQLIRQGLELAGWRKVPIGTDACGALALKTLPHIEQVYVNCSLPDMDEASFNRKLYMARRLAEKSIEETDRAVQILKSMLAGGKLSVLLVEHDMEAVFKLAHNITVLHRGRVIADGAPAVVAAERRVIDAYLRASPELDPG